jgi:hypothetical protein
MGFDDTFRERQPEADAARLAPATAISPEKSREQMGYVGGIDALAMIRSMTRIAIVRLYPRILRVKAPFGRAARIHRKVRRKSQSPFGASYEAFSGIARFLDALPGKPSTFLGLVSKYEQFIERPREPREAA